MAELAIFYMLYCARNFKKVQLHYLEDYRFAKMGIPKTELEGKTLGLVGIGNIGKLVAKKAALGSDMKVLAFDPLRPRGAAGVYSAGGGPGYHFQRKRLCLHPCPRHKGDHPQHQRPRIRTDEKQRLSDQHGARRDRRRARADPGPYKEGPGEINVPIACGGVSVDPGDIILADPDGVIVIPRKDAAAILEDAKKFQAADEAKAAAAKNGTANRAWVEKTLAAKEYEIIDDVYRP